MMLSGCKFGLQRFSSLNSNLIVRHGGSISVILLEDLPNRGGLGEIVSVKRGYARNFLVPKKIAAYGTPANKAKYASILKSTVPESNTAGDLLTGNIRFERAASLSGSLFGSVSVADIIAYYAEKQLEVKSVVIENEVIKALGKFVVKVDGVNVNVEVAPLTQQ